MQAHSTSTDIIKKHVYNTHKTVHSCQLHSDAMGRMGLHCDGGAAPCGLHVGCNLHRFSCVFAFLGLAVRSMSLVFVNFIDFHAFRILGGASVPFHWFLWIS